MLNGWENGWKNLFITGPVTSPIMVSNHWLSNDKLCLHSNSMSGRAFCVLPCHQLSFQVAPEREGENFGLIDFVYISKLSKKRILRYFYYDLSLSYCRPKIISYRSQGGRMVAGTERSDRIIIHLTTGQFFHLVFRIILKIKLFAHQFIFVYRYIVPWGRFVGDIKCGLDSCHF